MLTSLMTSEQAGTYSWSNLQPAVISLRAQRESMLSAWFIGCSPLWGNRIVMHSYISCTGLALWKTFHFINYNSAYVLFSLREKPCSVVGARQGGVKELSTKNLFLAKILKICQFYLVMFFVHNSLVPYKIPIHSVLLQCLLSLCHFSST